MPNWRKVIVSGSDAALNSLFITDTLSVSGSVRLGESSDSIYINNYRMPLTDGTSKQIMITDGLGNVAFDFNRTLYEEVKNVSGGTLPKGTPVHVVSTVGNTSNVIAASASLASTMPATYILDQTLNNDEEGLGIILGFINGVNTSGFGEGDIVYVGENGGYTNQKPTGSNLIQPLGIVIKVDATNGSGLVMNPGVTNDTPNLLTGQIFWGENNVTIQKPLADIISGSNFRYSGSFTGSLQGTSSYSTQAFSASYALTASYALNGGGGGDSLIRLSGSTIYPYNFGTENFSTTQSILIGSGSGYGTTYAKNSIFLGTEAGYSASFFDKNNEFPEDTEGLVGYMYAIGYQAGSGSDNSDNTVMIGTKAGANTNQSYQSVLIGTEAGAYSGSKQYSVTIGPEAGKNTVLYDSIAIGRQAGGATDTGNLEEGWLEEFGNEPIAFGDAVLIGAYTGYMAYNSEGLTAIGCNTGRYVYNSAGSTFIGASAGDSANNSPGSTFIGFGAGDSANNSPNSVFIGADAGDDANNSPNSVFIGTSAGIGTYSSSFSTYIGLGAGAYIRDSEIIKPSTVNNIVIGTLIGLPYDSSNAINIGGLIFGTGSYFPDAEAVYSGSANGRIGINQPNPQYSLDVSGSGNYTNGLRVTGSLIANTITGSLLGTASYATQALSSSYAVTSSHALNVSIRTAGTSLYSHNPSTTNFSLTGGIFLGTIAGALSGNADNSIFMGSAAGYEAAGSSTSNFIGYQAGFFAQDSNYSNFIGNQAGQYSSLATSSNFIGNQAGQYSGANNSNFFGTLAGAEVSNSHYSNFIGYFAGRGNNLGRNNILIGTNIGLPSGSRDRINIAGLIYGTGSYFNTSGAVFSGSANGRIGINQPNPQKEFDVSGSIRISQLSTSLTAPVTSGTTKMVISDANGDLSFTDIPAGGSITIADEGTSQGTATFLNFTGEGVTATVTSNTASISITGGGSAFPYTGSAQITGSLGITGSLAISSSLFQYADNTDVDIGTEVVLSIQTGSYRSAFFDYVISSGSNARAGTVMSVWGSSSIDFTETSTNDIGTTTDVTLSTILSGSFVQLRATTLSNNWTVKSLVRML